MSQDFLIQFFHESSFSKPLKIHEDHFKFFSKFTEIFVSRFITGINDTINFPTGTAGVVDTGGKFGEEGGPQIRSANSKSANLQTYKTCNFCVPSASVAICVFFLLFFFKSVIYVINTTRLSR